MDYNLVTEYYRKERSEIFDHICVGSHRILDLGCGVGNLGKYLKNNKYADEVIGIEINENAAEEARENIDQVYLADLNQVKVADLFLKDKVVKFDYIICADVLEHLINPAQVLTDLSCCLEVEDILILLAVASPKCCSTISKSDVEYPCVL